MKVAIEYATGSLEWQERIRTYSFPDENGCWVWQRHKDVWGYGRTSIGPDKARGAHRASFMAFIGPIPEGMTVDHLCFNPPCVNPDHLRLLPPLENARNQPAALKTHCAHGHEFTPENTRLQRRPGGTAWRSCRTCKQLRDRLRRTAA